MKCRIKKKLEVEIPEAPVYFCKQEFSGHSNKIFYSVIPDFSSYSTEENKVVNFLDVTIISRDSINSFTLLIHSLANMLQDVGTHRHATFLTDFFFAGIDDDQLCKKEDVEQALILTLAHIRSNMSEEDRSFENELSTTG